MKPRKLTQLDARRKELDTFYSTLHEYLEMCDRALEARSGVECPVVENLGQARPT